MNTFKSYLKGVNIEVFDSKFAYVSRNNRELILFWIVNC